MLTPPCKFTVFFQKLIKYCDYLCEDCIKILLCYKAFIWMFILFFKTPNGRYFSCESTSILCTLYIIVCAQLYNGWYCLSQKNILLFVKPHVYAVVFLVHDLLMISHKSKINLHFVTANFLILKGIGCE